MKIEEAIKRYINNAEYERTHGNLQGCLEFKQLADWLKELKQLREQTRWIPVSERLPNFAGVYLVTRYFPNNVMNPTYLVDACFFDGNDTWHDDNRINHYLTNVVAWLEEPEPYKASPTGAEGSDKE